MTRLPQPEVLQDPKLRRGSQGPPSPGTSVLLIIVFQHLAQSLPRVGTAYISLEWVNEEICGWENE